MKTAFAVVALFAGASAFNGKGSSGRRVTGVKKSRVLARACVEVEDDDCRDNGQRLGTGEP